MNESQARASTEDTPSHERVAARLAEKITSGVIQPRAQLVPGRLTTQYNISRRDAAEALVLLREQGLVIVVPKRGLFVRDPADRNWLPADESAESRITEAIAARVAAKDLQAGTRITLERLATAYCTSTKTAHRVLKRLVRQGIVATITNVGTFVRDRDDPNWSPDQQLAAGRCADAIAARIESGELPPRARLIPRALAIEYGMHRATVQAALRLVRDRGLVHLVRGRGTFVHDPTMRDPQLIASKSGRIAASIIADIEAGTLRPGTWLSRVEFARRYSVALPAMTAALAHVDKHGLIERDRSGRAFVRGERNASGPTPVSRPQGPAS